MTKFASNAASNRVVSLNALGRNRSPGQRTLCDCRDQLVTHLSLWLHDIAAPVSEELFVLADSTRERLLQTRYLDLRADIEKDWPHLVETFRRELSAEAERCQNQEIQKEGQSESPLEIPDFEGLQLLADDDLSEHIVIREFAAQLSESCDEELYTLNRRVAALLGHDELIDSNNPLAPAIICHALSNACAAIGSDAKVRLILLRRIERHLHLALPKIYQQINAYLIERGILPDLKRNYRRNTPAGETAPSQASASGNNRANSTTTPATLNAPNASSESILDALQRLAQARSGQQSAGLQSNNLTASNFGGNLTQGMASTNSQSVTLDAATINQILLASLNEMQHSPIIDKGGLITNQVRLVRDSESAQQVGGLEAVTLDIVAMLFDFIFDDAHIPVAIKALISRLQIPVLKVAMQNPGFFSDRQHPTRRFLGSVAGVSIRWGDSVDETDPFYRKLAELVEQIQTQFESDVEVFGKALVELEAFVDEREGEEDDTTQAVANIVIAREQEVEAWDRAQRAIKSFNAITKSPTLISTFLGEHWTGVLQAIALKHDDQSDEWKVACGAMKDLSWSVEAKKSPDDRLKLISLLPRLLAQLNKGLDSVATDHGQRTAFFDALVQSHSAALKGEIPGAVAPELISTPESAATTPAFSPSEEGDLLVTRSVDHGVEVEEVILVGASPIWRADDRAIFRQVSDLRRGDWVEFRDSENNISRERLNWISPQRGILLFSNHRSAKAISIAPEALARQIRDGNAVILDEEPIFERALSGALESMHAS